MSLRTHSLFYFGHLIDSSNFALDFNEGASELQGTLEVGSYTLTEFAAEVERVLNAEGALDYTVTVNRTTRKITIAASGNFSLLVSSGTRVGTDVFSLLGFTGADQSGDDTYEGDSASGLSYATQFILQSYVTSDNFKKARNPSVNNSASGEVEVFKYGDDAFFEMDFKFVTNLATSGTLIRNSATGVEDLIELLDYMVTKAPIEFMPDENTVATFFSLRLESTPADKTGLGYHLNELYGKGMPGFFETGILTLRDVS